MTDGMERLMDDLPDLQSDADVDALMGRLRAKLAPAPVAPVSSVPDAGTPPPATAAAFGDVVAAQEALASTMVRAMGVIAEALEELHADAVEHAARPASTIALGRRTGARLRATRSPSRGRVRKAR
jgi:hypothetical protein